MTNETKLAGGEIAPKKRSRRLLFLIITVFLLATSLFCLVGCEEGSKGLEYHYNDSDKTAKVTGIGSFAGDALVIPSTTRGYDVVAIDSKAFYDGCPNIKSVVIPDSVKTIGNHAFGGCTSLTSVTIGKNVAEIGYEAFGYLSNLTELKYNAIECADMEDVFIGSGADPGIKVTIGASVKKIPAMMFYQYNNQTHYGLMFYSYVTAIEFEEGSVCESIGSKAFRDTDIESIVLPDSITTIESYAFAECKELTDVVWSKSLTSIGDYAFWECDNLTKADLTDTALTEIGKWGFRECVSLAEIEIPASLTFVGDDAFRDDSALARVNYTGTIDQWAQINFVCPAYDATCIYSNPLTYAQDLYINDELVVEAKITTATKISPYAFNNCTNLMRVVIGESVDRVGYSAFSECRKIVEVINKSRLSITKGEESYGLVAYYALAVKDDEASDIKKTDDGFLFYTSDDQNYLLGYDGTATDLILPDNYNGEEYIINSYAFKNNSKITSVVVPDSVTEIKTEAFHACSNLKKVVIGNVAFINREAFRNCKSLTSLTIGEGVETIYHNAFTNCVNLREINFNAKNCNVYSLGAFQKCGSEGDGIKLTIGSQVTRISQKAFYYETNIAEVVFEEGSVCESIEEKAFYKNSNLTSISLPASIKSIGKSAFYYCQNLSSVLFAEGSQLQTIGDEAFAVCEALTTITIPKNVVAIGKMAFLNTGLETMIFDDPYDWYCTKTENATDGREHFLGTTPTNADYFKNTFYEYYWYKKA